MRFAQLKISILQENAMVDFSIVWLKIVPHEIIVTFKIMPKLHPSVVCEWTSEK